MAYDALPADDFSPTPRPFQAIPRFTRYADHEMIELTDVTKVFPGMEKPVVNRVSFSIGEGETVMHLGSSGCGKSATLELINRLLEPDSGVMYGRISDNETMARLNHEVDVS